jgi:C-terminal processing protease CtpA/Prc
MPRCWFAALLFAFALLASCQKSQTDLPPIQTDHEFDTDSKVHLDSLTPAQIENLATVARVWGFLKYHHPAVASGTRQWDYDLFRLLPAVLAAQNASSVNEVLVKWIDSLGPLPACRNGRPFLSGDLDLKPDIAWIHDQSLLGPGLVNRLETLYSSCPGPKTPFYISLMPVAGNARFDHELSYPGVKFPDSGFQLLALFRWWNIIQYWYPYRLVSQQDWAAVLIEFIPKLALARDKDAYSLAMLELIAKANDTHANLWNSLRVRPPVGPCWLRAQIRFVEDQPTVIDLLPDAKHPVPLQRGDVIESLDNVPVSKLIADWTPFFADSNSAARQRDMGISFTRGACGPVAVTVRRDGKSVSLSATREELPPTQKINTFHDRPGDTFQFLSPEIAYLKLSSIKATDVIGYLEKAQKTKGLIVDIRNYPSAFMPFTLGPALVTTPTQFASFSRPDLDNPGAFRFAPGDPISPGPFHYKGKVVILVDEVSQSQAEYTAMALRAAPGAIVVGSTTAGADGNASSIPLPGSLSTAISGIGVFYPDRRPTQRIGIVPDVVAKPTLAGLVAGRDEVLETAIRQILGPGIPRTEIERIATPSR